MSENCWVSAQDQVQFAIEAAPPSNPSHQIDLGPSRPLESAACEPQEAQASPTSIAKGSSCRSHRTTDAQGRTRSISRHWRLAIRGLSGIHHLQVEVRVANAFWSWPPHEQELHAPDRDLEEDVKNWPTCCWLIGVLQDHVATKIDIRQLRVLIGQGRPSAAFPTACSWKIMEDCPPLVYVLIVDDVDSLPCPCPSWCPWDKLDCRSSVRPGHNACMTSSGPGSSVCT